MRTFRTGISIGLKRLFSPSRTVVLDGRVSFETDPDKFFGPFGETLKRVERERGGALDVDLREAEFIYPSALIFLLALAETLGPSVRINLIAQSLSQIHEYLIFSGFSDYFNVPKLPENFGPKLVQSNVLKLETGDEILGTQQKAQWFIEQIATTRTLPNSFEALAVDSVDEILRNVKQHSAFTKWYGIGQAFPTSKKVRFVFYDNGEGIKKHITRGKYSSKHPLFREIITRNHYREMRDGPARVAIQAAATYMVSGTDYKDNSGAGIRFLIDDFGKAFSGTVSILSGNGLVVWHSGEVKIETDLPFEIRGTMVSVTTEGLE